MQSSDDMVLCKLIDDKIEIGDCVICSDVASGMLKANCLKKNIEKRIIGEQYVKNVNIIICNIYLPLKS